MSRYFTFKNTWRYIDLLQKLVRIIIGRSACCLANWMRTTSNSYDRVLYPPKPKVTTESHQKSAWRFELGDYVHMTSARRGTSFEKDYIPKWMRELFSVQPNFAKFSVIGFVFRICTVAQRQCKSPILGPPPMPVTFEPILMSLRI